MRQSDGCMEVAMQVVDIFDHFFTPLVDHVCLTGRIFEIIGDEMVVSKTGEAVEEEEEHEGGRADVRSHYR
jgi:hypothetical protein